MVTSTSTANRRGSSSPDPSSVTARARSFFEGRFPPRDDDLVWGEGDDSVVGSVFASGGSEAEEVENARAFQRDLFDVGLAWLRGPCDFGGSEFSREECQEFIDVAREYRRPDTSCFHVGQQILSPALVQHGTAQQKEKWLRALWRGEVIGCQLFSEPNAGSDLPSLLTRAKRTDGGWLIQGQKVWSSGAHLSEVGELLARTDDDLSLRHKGLSMFLLDMSSPGVTIRPLRQMTGNSHFCEVFLDNVFIPEGDLLGDLGAGWDVALTSLNSERDGFAGIDDQLFLQPLPRFVQLVEMLGKSVDPLVRADVVRSYIDFRIVGLLVERMETQPTGALAAAGSSLVKLASTTANFELAQRVASVLGSSITADGGSWGHYCWSQMLLGVFAPRIAGGTDQIQRNLIAERGLGLPREPRDPVPSTKS